MRGNKNNWDTWGTSSANVHLVMIKITGLQPSFLPPSRHWVFSPVVELALLFPNFWKLLLTVKFSGSYSWKRKHTPFTCTMFPLSKDRYKSSSLSLDRFLMCSLELNSLTFCSSAAFCSFSLRSDFKEKSFYWFVFPLAHALHPKCERPTFTQCFCVILPFLSIM